MATASTEPVLGVVVPDPNRPGDTFAAHLMPAAQPAVGTGITTAPTYTTPPGTISSKPAAARRRA